MGLSIGPDGENPLLQLLSELPRIVHSAYYEHNASIELVAHWIARDEFGRPFVEKDGSDKGQPIDRDADSC